jgi:hypothetical protein
MSQTHIYYITVAQIRDQLLEQAEAQGPAKAGEPAVFEKAPRGQEWKASEPLEQAGRNWLVWLTSQFNAQLVPTGHKEGKVSPSPCHLWLAARQIYSGGWRVSTPQEVKTELARQADAKKEIELADLMISRRRSLTAAPGELPAPLTAQSGSTYSAEINGVRVSVASFDELKELLAAQPTPAKSKAKAE